MILGLGMVRVKASKWNKIFKSNEHVSFDLRG